MSLPERQPSDPYGLCGETLAGKYRVERLIGSGGFGVVYRGTHGGFDEPIAIKCLRVADDLPEAERGNLLAKLRAEGAVLHRLSKRSSAIVQALDVDAATTPSGDWVPYLILEWLEGETLAEHLAARPPLTVSEAIEVLAPAFEALGLAHRRGVAHRDVKPENLFLEHGDGGPKRALKVLDFGIAKVLHGHAAFTASPAATHERATAFTPLYGAPEQFNKRLGATGPWTDVFALALVLVEMVTGRRALEGDTPTQLYVAATNPDVRPSLRYHGVDPGPAIEALLQQALAIDPTARLQDAGAFWEGLQEALGHTSADRASARGLPDSDVPAADTAAFLQALESGDIVSSSETTRPNSAVELADTEEAFTTLPQATGVPLSTGPPSAATRAEFEVQVIALARQGTPLTVANVVARTGLMRDHAASWLEELSDRDELQRASDASLGTVYSVPGLTVVPSRSRAARARRAILRWLQVDAHRQPTLPPAERKSVPFGIGLAVFVPFFGLLYAAPVLSALLVSLGTALFIGALNSLPLIGHYLELLTPLFWASVVGPLGGAYTWHYNRHGRRIALRAVHYGTASGDDQRS